MSGVQRTAGNNSGVSDATIGDQHLIRAGETLSEIAKRFNTTVADLMAANQQLRNPDRIYAGQTLVIPNQDRTEAGADGQHYTVRRGDTLTAIAERSGIDLARLIRANVQLKNPNLIRPGQQIKLPTNTNQQRVGQTVDRTGAEPTGGGRAPNEGSHGGGATSNTILNGIRPTGAANDTARQDGLPQRGITGVRASHQMAETDSRLMMRHKEKFEAAARRYNLPPALLAAIASRESRGGAALDRNGFGDHGHGFGLMQVDNRNPFPVVRAGGPFGQQHINQAASIFRSKLDEVEREFPNLTEEQQLQTAVSRYNGGARRPFPNSDVRTTGGDYSNDVLARAQYYARTEQWSGQSSTPPTSVSPTSPPLQAPSGITAPGANLRRGARGAEVRQLQTALVRLGHMRQSGMNTGPGVFGPRTFAALQRFQQANNLTVDGIYGPQTRAALARVLGTPSPVAQTPGTPGVRLDGSTSVDTVLPASGRGYTTYNRESGGADQYGRASTIRALQDLGQSWAGRHPNAPIGVGDISRRGGGRFPPHSSHQRGIDVDIRPFTRDGRQVPTNINDSNYDRGLTRELIQMIKQKYPNAVILFNDPQLIREGLAVYEDGHHNHLHVRFQ